MPQALPQPGGSPDRRVILPEGAIGGITGRFAITAERFANLIPLMCGLGCGGRSRRNGAGSDNAEQCPFDRIIDAQATERDAARFAVVHPAARAAVTGDVMLHTAVAQRQLAATTPAADEPSEQRLAMLGRAMMTARGHVTGDHCTDRFEPLPVHIAFVGVRLEDEPLGARLPADLRACAKDAVPRRYAVATAALP